MLIALYIGGISGGFDFSNTVKYTRNTPSSVATCFDGRPLAGKRTGSQSIGSRRCILIHRHSSCGVLLLILISPLLASLAIKFSPYEYCSFA